MGLPAVGLDDHAVRGPVEVGHALAVVGGVQRLVADRLGEVRAAHQSEHPDLPVALGDLRLLSGRLLQDAGSAVAVGAGDDVVDGALVVELEVHGLRQRAFELVVSHRCRQVEQGAVDGRDRDAFVAGGVLGIEGTRGVQADPRDAVRGRAARSRRCAPGWSRGAPSARPRCDGSGPRRVRRPARRPNGGPRAAASGVADGVDPAMNPVQPARGRTAVCTARAPIPSALELRAATPLPTAAQPAPPARDRGGGPSWRSMPSLIPATPRTVPANSRQRTPQTPQLSAAAHPSVP